MRLASITRADVPAHLLPVYDREMRKAHARRSLIRFTEYTTPGWMTARAHEEICARLETFSLRIKLGLSPRLIFEAPPRIGKSTITAQRFPVWHLGRNPRHEVVVASYGQELSDTHSRAAKAVTLEAQPLWPHMRPKPGEWAVRRWSVASTPPGLNAYKAVGRGGPLTGTGMNLGIIDDPIKDAAEANSQTIRDGLWEWFGSTFMSRLAPGAGVVVMHTRWHTDDLVGRLLREEGDDWEVLSLPALAEGNDWREPGESIHEERYPREYYEAIRKKRPHWFAALYQQRPIPKGGGMFRSSYWRRYGESPDLLAESLDDLVISLDAAEESHANACNSSLQVWGRRGAAKYLLADVAGQWTYTELREHFIRLRQRFPEATAIIEAGGHGVALAQEMETSHRYGWGITLYRPGSDARLGKVRSKQARAAYTEREAVAGNIYLPDRSVGSWSAEWEAEHESFPKGAMKDRVDAASQVLVHWWHLDHSGNQDEQFMDALDQILG